MNELVKIQINENQEQMVSARELHRFLEVGADFRHWFPRMLEYGFDENVDFNPVIFDQVQIEGKREVKRTITDYMMTIAMAKEICMITRNEKGKQARQYFLNVEKAWNSPDMVMARALQMSNRQLIGYQEKVIQLESQIEFERPKVVFADAVAASKSSVLVGDLAKMIKQNGVEIGQNRLFQWLRENGYLIKRKGMDFNMPTQKSMELGLFQVKETAVTHSDGHVTINKTPKVTGKGQSYFINKFLYDREMLKKG